MKEREITKLAINTQGEIEQRKCHLQARKIPLQDIKKKPQLKTKTSFDSKTMHFMKSSVKARFVQS